MELQPPQPAMELAPLDTLVTLATNHATQEAEAVMEAVMAEGVRLLREEFEEKLQEVANRANKVESSFAKSALLVASQGRMLAGFAETHDTFRRELDAYKRQLAACSQAQEQVKKDIAEQKVKLAICMSGANEESKVVDPNRQLSILAEQVMQHDAELRNMSDNFELLTKSSERRLSQSSPDTVTHAELQCLRDQLKIQSVNALDDLKVAVATEIQVLQSRLSKMDCAFNAEEFKDVLNGMRAQMLEMHRKFSDMEGQPTRRPPIKDSLYLRPSSMMGQATVKHSVKPWNRYFCDCNPVDDSVDTIFAEELATTEASTRVYPDVHQSKSAAAHFSEETGILYEGPCLPI